MSMHRLALLLLCLLIGAGCDRSAEPVSQSPRSTATGGQDAQRVDSAPARVDHLATARRMLDLRDYDSASEAIQNALGQYALER